jgi:hypothetical protein
MLVTANADLIDSATPFATKPDAAARTLVWTDAFSSLLQVLKK